MAPEGKALNIVCPDESPKTKSFEVRYCPQWGEVVSGNIPSKDCSEDLHAERRRERNKLCVDCGAQLI